MSEKNFTPIDLDNATLDDIDDLPSFKPFPTGAYHVRLDEGMEKKQIGTHPGVAAKLTLVAVLECKDLEDKEDPPVPGDKTDIAYLLDNETGAGFFKMFISPIMAKIGTTKYAEGLAASKGMELVVVGTRGKPDPVTGRQYFNIKQCAIAE